MHIIEYIKCLCTKHEVFLFKQINPANNFKFIKVCINCKKFFTPTLADALIYINEVDKELMIRNKG